MYSTCLTGERLPFPGQSTFETVTPLLGEHASTVWASSWSFSCTCSVHAASSFDEAGRSTTLTVPPVCVPSNRTEPLPPGPGPLPLALATHNRYCPGLPVTVRADGYHPVGMYRGAPPGRSPVCPSSTSTAFMPASATNSQRPSGDSANASGWAPTGTPAIGRTVCVATTRAGFVVTSRTEIVGYRKSST